MVGLSGYSVVSEQFRFPKGKQGEEVKIPVFHRKMTTTRNKFTGTHKRGPRRIPTSSVILLFVVNDSSTHACSG